MYMLRNWFCTKSLILLASTFGFASNAYSDVDLITNGSFEVPYIGSGFDHFTSIPGWNYASVGRIEIQCNVAGTAYHGDQLVELDSYRNSDMVQTVTVVPNQNYTLRFFYSPRPWVSYESNPVELWINDEIVDVMSGYCEYDTEWRLCQYQLISPTSNINIEFRASGISDGYGGYLDKVSLVAGDGTVSATELPAAFQLNAPYPNPFNPVTTLDYTLRQTCQARLAVLNMAGHELAVLAQGLQESGPHSVRFNAAGLPSGMYLARLEAMGQSSIQKLLLIK